MIAFAALLVAGQPIVLNESEVRLSEPWELEWDCQRDGGKDRLILSEPKGPEGNVPLFTRILLNQPPKVVVDCSPEVTRNEKTTVSMFSGFCPHEWGLEMKLVDGNPDRATADLRLGHKWYRGYACVRRHVETTK